MSSLGISSGLSSSHIYPNVYRAAFLISISLLAALLLKLGMRSSHSFLGISIAAIVATALATCVLTSEEGVAKLYIIASLIELLKATSKFTHKLSYLESYDHRY